ncbi:MAG TPA: hypothetical protein VIU33_08015, partial [Nitrospiria bacterium]
MVCKGIKRFGFFGFLVFLLAFVPGGPVFGDEGHGHSDDDAREVILELSEFRFSPDVIELRGGEPVHLKVRNTGTVLHEFVTEAFLTTPVALEVSGAEVVATGIEEFEVPAGGEIELEFTPRKR